MPERAWISALSEPSFDWRLLQAFAEVVERGSLRSASLGGRHSINTLRARIERLETLTGRELLTRSLEGVAVTNDGQKVLAVIGAMVAVRDQTIVDLVESERS